MSVAAWPAQARITASFSGIDARRIVAVDTGCAADEIDEEWKRSVVIGVADDGDFQNVSWFRGSLWEAARGAATSSRELEQLSGDNNDGQLLDGLLQEGEVVFLKRGKNFRRYSVVTMTAKPSSESSTNAESATLVVDVPLSPAAKSCSSSSSSSSVVPRSPTSISVATTTATAPATMARATRVVVMEEDKKQAPDSIMKNIDAGAVNEDDDERERHDEGARETRASIASHHPKRAKVFTQAVAFEFVQDVIGGVMAQRGTM